MLIYIHAFASHAGGRVCSLARRSLCRHSATGPVELRVTGSHRAHTPTVAMGTTAPNRVRTRRAQSARGGRSRQRMRTHSRSTPSARNRASRTQCRGPKTSRKPVPQGTGWSGQCIFLLKKKKKKVCVTQVLFKGFSEIRNHAKFFLEITRQCVAGL